MKIQFKINRLDLFLRGIDTASSIASLEVDPATLPMEQRKLVYRHLLRDEASDAFNVVYDPVRAEQPNEIVPVGGHPGAELIEAESPTLDSLLAALEELQSRVTLLSGTTVFAQNQFRERQGIDRGM